MCVLMPLSGAAGSIRRPIVARYGFDGVFSRSTASPMPAGKLVSLAIPRACRISVGASTQIAYAMRPIVSRRVQVTPSIMTVGDHR